jgi:hypothetical protein
MMLLWNDAILQPHGLHDKKNLSRHKAVLLLHLENNQNKF